MFKKNLNTSDIIVDALSTVLTAAVKHLVIDRGIEYARTKVDEALTPPEIEKEPQDEVEEKENEDVQSPKSAKPNRNANTTQRKQAGKKNQG